MVGMEKISEVAIIQFFHCPLKMTLITIQCYWSEYYFTTTT